MKKKVLIITYYWPPAGGPGVQRWLKFVKYLPEFAIDPIVFIPENPTYPIKDEQLQNEVSSDLEIIKFPINEPYKFAKMFSKDKTQQMSAGLITNHKKQTFLEKILLWVRGNVFIPDARIGWVNPSINYLKSYIETHQIDTVITTGPPHSVHLIGLGLKKMLAIRWIADFRDPWTSIGYHKELKLSAKAAEQHKLLEKRVLTQADEIIVTSPTTKKEFEQITNQPIQVITNGYDVEYVEKRPLDNKFSLAHIGSLLSERNPRVLWKALRELVKEDEQFAKDFELKLVGKISKEVLDAIEEFKLTPYLNNMGYVSHEEALVQQRTSQVLLLIEIDSYLTKGIIPGKLYEYMAAERPILGIGPEDADFANILKSTNAGVFCQYDEKDVIKEHLLNYYRLFKDNNLKVYAMGLQYYSRKKLTEKLAEIIKKSV